jgi:E3 ubiquitin-protein ligase TRIP12
MACAASLAVQSVIRKENLLENNLKQGAYLLSLLKSRLLSPNSPAAPHVFDIRGGGLWFGIEFVVPAEKFATQKFAMVVQARCLDNGLIIMGLTGGAAVDGKSGDHCMLSPAYNVTREEVCNFNLLCYLAEVGMYDQIEKIVDIFVQSVEDVVKESGL